MASSRPGSRSAPQRRQVSLLAKLTTPQAVHFVLFMRVVVLCPSARAHTCPRHTYRFVPLHRVVRAREGMCRRAADLTCLFSTLGLTPNPPVAIKASARDISVRVSSVPVDWRSYELALCRRRMCVMVLCAASAHAQFDSAQISGVVQDSTGAVLPGVDVTLVNVGTRIERQAVTNEAGLYTFPTVPVGEYRITAMLSGFKPITKSNVQVNAGLNIRVDVSLEVGALTRDDSGRGGDDARGYVGDRTHAARRTDCRNAAQRTAGVAGRAARTGSRRRQHGRLGADRCRHVRDGRDVDQRRPRRRVHDDDRRRAVDSRACGRRLHDGRAELRHGRRGPGPDDELPGGVRPVVSGTAAAGDQERHAELPRQRVLESSERCARCEHVDAQARRPREVTAQVQRLRVHPRRTDLHPRDFQRQPAAAVLLLGSGVAARSHRRGTAGDRADGGDAQRRLQCAAPRARDSRPAHRSAVPGERHPARPHQPAGPGAAERVPAADSRVPAGREQLDRQPVGLQQPAEGQHQDRLGPDVESPRGRAPHVGAQRLERSRTDGRVLDDLGLPGSHAGSDADQHALVIAHQRVLVLVGIDQPVEVLRAAQLRLLPGRYRRVPVSHAELGRHQLSVPVSRDQAGSGQDSQRLA